MENEKIIKFVLAIYKITEKFPKDEPLKSILRKNICNLLESYFLYFSQEKNKSNLNLLKTQFLIFYNLLLIAENQNWLDKKNFEVLKRELLEIKNSLNNPPFLSEKEIKKKNTQKSSINTNDSAHREERCQKILEILKERESIQPADLQRIFPDITKRTIRRDLRYLYQTGKILRIGTKNNTNYKLNRTLMIGHNDNQEETKMS